MPKRRPKTSRPHGRTASYVLRNGPNDNVSSGASQ